MKKSFTVLAALGLALTGLAIAPQTARADTPCTITGFSPRSAVVGLSPKVVTFKPTVTGCDLQGWSIQGGDYDFFVYDGAPQEAFSPYDNDETAPKDVVVEAYNADYEERVRSFPNGFVLKRNTGWDQFNASPEPVKKGAKITIKGRLRVADWDNDRYVGYTNRGVSVEFRTKTGEYRRIKVAYTRAGGYLTTTVTAASDGYWRLNYTGNTIAGGSAVAGDFVDVR